MCGRYGIVPEKDFVDEFEIENRNETRFHAEYNLPPGGTGLVVTMNSPKQLHLANFGFIPVWAKDKKIGYSTANARSEEVDEKPMYKSAYKNKRCLIPVSNYYEFAHLKDDPKVKIPYLFKLKKEKYFALAGLYSMWKDPTKDQEIYTFTILTTEANDLGAKVHSRMPVILHKKDWDVWADNSNFDSVVMKSFLKAYPAKEMETWPVSRELNKADNDHPDLLKPVKEVPITPSRPAWEEKLQKKAKS